jgi:tRNA(Arg) A34 adenosine deaminase TadA
MAVLFFLSTITIVLSLLLSAQSCSFHEVQHLVQQPLPPPQLTINSIPYPTRAHWMRRATAALAELSPSPCPFSAFASVIVNHTDPSSLGDLICIGINSASTLGNPTLHGEIATINNCSEILQASPFGLSPAEAVVAFRSLSLYTTAEACPMCASAIRWASFREYIYGTSITTLIKLGWGQIRVSSMEIFEKSFDLPYQTTLLGNVLANETDPYFSWQFNPEASCPQGCVRGNSNRCIRHMM